MNKLNIYNKYTWSHDGTVLFWLASKPVGQLTVPGSALYSLITSGFYTLEYRKIHDIISKLYIIYH
jgi:hypothetical protein